MTIETLTRAQLANDFGYTDIEGNPSERAIAQFMRDALSRWVCARRALLKHAREQLRAAEVSADTVPRVLERLVALGESGGRGRARGTSRPPSSLGGSGGGLGCCWAPSPCRANPSVRDARPRRRGGSRPRRERGARDDSRRAAPPVSLAEWIHPLVTCTTPRAGRRARSALTNGLAMFWERLPIPSTRKASIDPDAEVRAVVGPPGGFETVAATVEGRWREDLPEGVWCAYRRGHGDDHWLLTLVSVDGTSVAATSSTTTNGGGRPRSRANRPRRGGSAVRSMWW